LERRKANETNLCKGELKMPIKTIEKFICPLCGYITETPENIARIKKNGGICPKCQNGKGKSWQSTNHKPIHSC
jgi:predicted RNA-binding Zn-ribbon protein involved in translation (DUF1610 family)